MTNGKQLFVIKKRLARFPEKKFYITVVFKSLESDKKLFSFKNKMVIISQILL